MPTPRVAVFIATSLDGCIARTDGSLDWLDLVKNDGEDYGYAEFMQGLDTVLMGRATWDVVRGFDPWPYEGKRVVVLTHRPESVEHGEELASGPIDHVLEQLGATGSSWVYIDGGVVIRQALQAGMVDELILSIVPVILGDGPKLFGPDLPERTLRLVSSQVWPSGLVQLRYSVGSSPAPRPGAA